MTRFAGRTVLVTGASSGLGRATSERLAHEGATLLLVGRNAERLEIVRGSLSGAGHVAHVCDVVDEAAVTTLAAALEASGTVVHGLFHAAGLHRVLPLQLTDSAALRAMLDSHVVSSFAVSRALVRQRLTAKEGCSIVLMTSAAALQGGAGAGAYAAAKGGLIAAVRVLAVELARRAVRVNAIAAGVVHTPQSEAWLSKLSQEQVAAIAERHLLGFGNPEQIASVAAFLLSDDASWITGTTLVADGGLTAH